MALVLSSKLRQAIVEIAEHAPAPFELKSNGNLLESRIKGLAVSIAPSYDVLDRYNNDLTNLYPYSLKIVMDSKLYEDQGKAVSKCYMDYFNIILENNGAACSTRHFVKQINDLIYTEILFDL